MVHYFQKEIGNYFGCIWFSRLQLTNFSIFSKKNLQFFNNSMKGKKKLWLGECERGKAIRPELSCLLVIWQNMKWLR